MKYVVWYHGPNEPERVTIHSPHFGQQLDRDEARRVARDVAEHFGVAEGIELQDPPEPVYRPFPCP